ncbi:PQQ-binding-like beta-propeller repeat protein [Stappia taiwanensis]|uniref:PQQ-binding-like beta-propeller repeat protein n=1 Tax=Stappia taiwanensis TaxID=992267 RepID=A0A838XZ16_9HYPH|nr:PQQ-binding-like beta-propeller repeat protein [Stappia taiwanensis]MBA4613686.1 PQQ-binding-like beta-propeller repeat protein [Stappia taiwanensis]GGE81437.1 outer membrane protein assembly factor BamB [Stappia taiwanensis]
MTRGFMIRAALLCGALALAGCETVSDLNPFSKDDEILPGEREALFAGADPLAETTGKTARVGKATSAGSWTHGGGNAANNPGNVATNISGGRAWRASIGGSGGGLFSGAVRIAARPVAAGGRIFVYAQNGDVVALSTNGGRAWRRSLRPEGENDVASGGGVVVDGGRVFAATGYGQLAALDAGSGRVLWTKDIGAPARQAPAAANGTVFAVTQTGEVHALAQEDGAERWTYSGIAESSGLLAFANPAISGGLVIVPFTSGEVMAVDIKSGEPKWIEGVTRSFRTRAVSGFSDVSASPVVADGVVYASGVSGRLVASKLRTGERLWEQNVGSVHTPVVSGGAVFLVDIEDRMVAIDRKSGEPLWRTALPSLEKKKRINWAGPVLANGVLVAVSSDGRLVRVDATSGRILATTSTSEDIYVTPIIAGGRMITITSKGDVVAFN